MVISFVPQIAVADLNAEELPSYHRNVDNDESVFVHHDELGSRKPGMLSHTPQGILHGADEATRDAFQKPAHARNAANTLRGQCRYRPAADGSAAYERLT